MFLWHPWVTNQLLTQCWYGLMEAQAALHFLDFSKKMVLLLLKEQLKSHLSLWTHTLGMKELIHFTSNHLPELVIQLLTQPMTTTTMICHNLKMPWQHWNNGTWNSLNIRKMICLFQVKAMAEFMCHIYLGKFIKTIWSQHSKRTKRILT